MEEKKKRPAWKNCRERKGKEESEDRKERKEKMERGEKIGG